jgi:hypothetical protein
VELGESIAVLLDGDVAARVALADLESVEGMPDKIESIAMVNRASSRSRTTTTSA